MVIVRPQWPHTIEDIIKAVDGVWGVVGATNVEGNLVRLEKSFKEPYTYTFTEFAGSDESRVKNEEIFDSSKKQEAIKIFAQELGFVDD